VVDKSNKSLDDPAYQTPLAGNMAADARLTDYPAMARQMTQLASAGQRYRDLPIASRFGQWPALDREQLMRRIEDELSIRWPPPGTMIPGQQYVDPLGYRGERDPATGYYLLRGMAAGGRIADEAMRRRDPGRPPYQGLEPMPIVPPNSYPTAPYQQMPNVLPPARRADLPFRTYPVEREYSIPPNPLVSNF
jgi:hypothetical protein